MAHWLVTQSKHSVRRVCRLLQLSQSVYRYTPRAKDDIEVIERMNAWVEKKPRWGFWKIYTRLRKDGVVVNHKRLHRLYTVAGLNMRRPTKKRVPERVREPICLPIGPNITWSMDFMSDAFIGGRKYRTFNVMDDFGREALNITIDTSIRSEYVTRELDQLIEWRGKPERLRVDNGPEFIAQAMEEWAERNKIEITFIEPGKPMQNGLIERFNRTYREDVLDAYIFENLEQVRERTKEFIWSYNNERPHDALMDNTPREFLLKCGQLPSHYTGSRADFPTFQQDDHYIDHEMMIFRNSRT